jgi:hypothetical protein
VLTRTMTTKATGSVVFKFRPRYSDPIGVFQVRADATLNNERFGSATTSFTVQ